jgi:proteic killer suppression protein
MVNRGVTCSTLRTLTCALRIIGVLCHNANVGIKSYRNKATRDIARNEASKEARRALPISLHDVARRRLAFLAAVETLADLRARHALGSHALKGGRKGQYVIKINDQFRVCFVWSGCDAEGVEITDYH